LTKLIPIIIKNSYFTYPATPENANSSVATTRRNIRRLLYICTAILPVFCMRSDGNNGYLY